MCADNATANASRTSSVILPSEVYEIAMESMGAFFEPIAKMDRRTITTDFLDLSRCINRTLELDR